MPQHEAISLNFKPVQKPTTQADFTYSITPNTISITDTGEGGRSVTNDIEALSRLIVEWCLRVGRPDEQEATNRKVKNRMRSLVD